MKIDYEINQTTKIGRYIFSIFLAYFSHLGKSGISHGEGNYFSSNIKLNENASILPHFPKDYLG